MINLINKKQLLTTASVAVAFFLLGSMFIGGLMAMNNDDGNPWDRVWTAITGLESRVETLEEQSLPQGFITAPAYDSGWTNLNQKNQGTLQHNLGTTNVIVLITWAHDQNVWWWDLTENEIKVQRNSPSGSYEIRHDLENLRLTYIRMLKDIN